MLDRVIAAFQSFESVQSISAVLSAIIFIFFAALSIFTFIKALPIAKVDIEESEITDIAPVVILIHLTNQINFYASIGCWFGILILYGLVGTKFGIVGNAVLITLLMFIGMIFFVLEIFYCCQLYRHKAVERALGGGEESQPFVEEDKYENNDA